DENGLIFPLSIAPYEVLVIPLNVTETETMNLAESIYNELGAGSVDVLLDDRDARAGFKFKDADLIGVPLRIVIGGKGLNEGAIEGKWRNAAAAVKVPIADAAATVRKMLADRKHKEA